MGRTAGGPNVLVVVAVVLLVLVAMPAALKLVMEVLELIQISLVPLLGEPVEEGEAMSTQQATYKVMGKMVVAMVAKVATVELALQIPAAVVGQGSINSRCPHTMAAQAVLA